MSSTDSIIAVLLNIGHKASHRVSPHPTGYTHNWSAYVQGAEGIAIEEFVDKVVFKLHETFENPVQVVTSPPYMICESGYASFALKLEIHFSNETCHKGENVIHYEYDLYLPGDGQPPVKHFRQERLLFKNTPPEFRAKLKAGGAKETKSESIEGERQANQMVTMTTDNRSSKLKLSDEEKKEKKKKHKDTINKHKKSKSKPKAKPDFNDSLFSHSRYNEDAPNKTGSDQMDGSNSDSSSSSSSSSSDESSDPSHSPPIRSASQTTKSKIPALSASESSDDENFNNNSSVKRVSDSNHISSSSQISKKTKLSRPAKKSERNSGGVVKGPNGVPVDVLLDLHEKIKGTEDRNLLQRFVDIIEETSQYKLTDTSFDFDLCHLDSATINKLENLIK